MSAEHCPRCNGSGLGSVCFPSRSALVSACADSAGQIEAALCADLASLPDDEARRVRLDGMRKHHSADFVARLRRQVWRVMQAKVAV